MSQRYLQQVVKHDLLTNGGDPDHVYLDINVINNNQNRGPVHLTYRETRDKPIIQDCSEYYLAVVRFHIDTQSALPLMLPLIQTGQNDPNLTVYSFTFKYQNIVYQKYVDFIPQDKTAPLPRFPIAQQDMSGTYYYIYNYQWWVDLLNITLGQAFEGFQNALAAGHASITPANVPFFMYDPASSELVLNADKLYFDESLDNPCFIFCNTPMKNLLSGFDFEIDSYADPNGCNYKFSISNQFNTNVLEISDSYSAIQMYQSYPCTSTWNCVQSIVVTSSNLPIVPTIQAAPQIFGSNTTLNNNISNINVNILSDFEIALENGKEFLPSINYSPFLYRLIPMNGNSGLNTIDLAVYWRDIYGNLHQFMIGSNSHCDFKLLFRKKYLGV